jgi:tetratricopeptide (TPR) repeat protein
MTGHTLPPEALQRFLAGTAGPGERKEITQHLFQGCKVCRTFFRKLVDPDSHALPSIGPSYDQAFEKARQVIRGLGDLEEPRRMLLELTSHPFSRQEMLVRYQRRYWTTSFFELLVRESSKERFSDLGEMQRLARLAVLVAERLGKTLGDPEEASAYRARAWMVLGNALRISGNLNGADQSLLRAKRRIESSSEHLALRAELLSLFSSLRRDQCRLEDALEMGRQEIALRRTLYSPEDVIRSLMTYAVGLSEGGRFTEAIGILREAETTLGATESPWLALMIRHNSICYLVDGGAPDLAYQLFSDLPPNYREIEEPLIRVKTWWLKAKILAALDEPGDALDLLRATQQHFLEQESPLAAASAGLEMAVVLAKLGRKREVRRVAAAALREFGVRGIQRDYLAALILLRQAS